jgi:hypothetical protein
MHKIKVLLILAIILSAVSAAIASNTIYVAVNGPNDPGSGAYKDPFRRIQDAIDIAASGDTIKILPGLYTGNGNYELDPSGKSITIRSIDPNNPANTIIDPNKAGRGFNFYTGEDANCILSGLTIRNGYAQDNSGGGIYCYDSKPLITNCIITDNTTDWYGGGIYCYDASPKITHCIIKNNSAIDGGGLELSNGTPEITNCIITNNTVIGFGGGADFYYLCNPTLTNCTITKNYADSGGGLSCTDSNVIIQNSILWQNQANQGTQISLELPISSKATLTISYSNLQGEQAAIFDPCTGLTWRSGNINVDPCFASFNPNDNPNTWDFHLQSAYGRWNYTFHRIDLNNDGIINFVEFARLADVWLLQGTMPEDLDNSGTVDWTDMKLFAQYFLATAQKDGWITDSNTSLCIDAGDPNSNWSNEPWPNGKRINMGAYGGTSQASKNGNPADFNIDHLVNFVDFAQMANQWLTEQTGIEDLTKDGKIDFADIAVFAENWLWEKK